ncbi:MAG: hypothetical protein WBV69_23025 [Candidatus Sulfotelmatobacter sp.]
MANLKRIPKVGDRVLSSPRNSSFVVVAVHRNPDVVDLSPLKGSAKLDLVERGIPWVTLTYIDELDESQNALRVVREATEDS